jgi:hypothetical protein
MNFIEQHKNVINELADKIARKTKYPEVTITYSEAISFIRNYVQTSILLKTHYTGTTSAEAQQFLGNVFTQAIYLKEKGLLKLSDIKDKDIMLRDKIWITISLIREHALQDNRFIPIWKPYLYVQEQAKPSQEQSQPLPSRSEGVPSNKPLLAIGLDNSLWWLAGGALLLMLLA